MADNVLKEFLVALGWKNDDVAMRKTLDGVEKFTVQFLKLGSVVVATEAAVIASLNKIARTFEDAYYASSRTGASVKELTAFKYAASQMGSSAEEAGSAVEGLMRRLRENPGYGNLLRSLGVSDVNDGVKAPNQLKSSLAAMPLYVAEQRAAQLGISENLLLALRRGAEFDKFQDESNRKLDAMGLDPEKAAQDGQALERLFRSLGSTFDVFKAKVGSSLFERLGPDIQKLDEYLQRHGDQIANIIVKIADALLKIFTYIVEHLDDIDHFVDKIGGWNVALTALAVILANSVLPGLNGLLKILFSLSTMVLPKWLLGLIGAAGLTAAAAAATMNYGEASGQANINGSMEAYAKAHPDSPNLLAPGSDRRTWWQKTMPKWLGGKDAADRTPVAPPGPPGTYRSQYKVSDADLSDQVVNTIAGEAQNNPNSIDAVINTMFNRLGTSAYGPSGNLLEVARARGQFTGYRHATPQQAALIRARIRAIASGGVADNTRGANEYRASWYNGPWARNHPYAPVVGGNRFAYNPRAGRGPYASHAADPNAAPPAPPALMPSLPSFLTTPPPALSTAPLGGTGSQASIDRSVTMTPSTTINVTGVSDPQQAAAQVGASMNRQNANLFRDLQSAIG